MKEINILSMLTVLCLLLFVFLSIFEMFLTRNEYVSQWGIVVQFTYPPASRLVTGEQWPASVVKIMPECVMNVLSKAIHMLRWQFCSNVQKMLGECQPTYTSVPAKINVWQDGEFVNVHAIENCTNLQCFWHISVCLKSSDTLNKKKNSKILPKIKKSLRLLFIRLI